MFVVQVYIRSVTPLYLLGLHGLGVFPAKCQLSYRDVIQDDVEVTGTFCQLLADHQTDLLTLRDQLGSIELGHNTFQHL